MQRLLVNLQSAIALVLAAGCHVGEPEPIAQPTLRVLDSSEEALVSVTPDALNVAANARVLDGLGVGDAIVSSGADPFLRKVTSIAHNGNVVVLATEPGALTDAIFAGEMVSSGDVFAREIQQGADDGFVIPVDQLALDFNNATLINEAGIKVEIDRGTIRFRPSLDIDLQVADGWLSNFHVVVDGQLSAQLGVKITSERSFERSFSKTIWKSPVYRAVQFVGPVPVVEGVQVSLIASGDAYAGASGTVSLGSASATASMRAGAAYDQGSWRTIANPGIALNASGPSTQLGATARASLKLTVRIDVKFYDVAGPNLTIGTYARTAVSSATGWSGRVGIDGAFGGNVTVLGKTLASYNKTLFDVGRNFGAP